MSLVLFGGAIAVSAATQTLDAQEGPAAVIHDGDAIVTGFSGVSEPAGDLPRGVNLIDETFIDAGAASLKVFDVSKPGQAPDGQLFAAPVRYQAEAGDIGQVFGVALDDAPTPNIYTTATSAFGLQIVAPDSDGDGRPERLKSGQANARWMKGQFGTEKNGGPGSVWKIDGATGEVTLFAMIETDGRANSGPALGNITFDSDHQQLYVSDRDSGMIHRLDLAGKDLGHFDHGVQGRPAQDLEAVAFDPENKFEITSKTVDTTDPTTWGFADDRRRVWGVTYADGRVYYAVADGPQIWSVGIEDDGGFSDDVHWELDPAVNPKGGPVSDIAFTSSGDMILAQRGVRAADYDYSAFQEPGNNRVLRYSLETPDEPRTKSRWKTEPHDYAIGFSASHENGAGGIAIGYGYAQGGDGALDLAVCEGTLWTTGDLLRKRTDLRRELAKGGKLAVNGLQGNALSLVRPDNVPPWKSLFVDFDGGFSGPDVFGHVGGITVMHRCPNERVETPSEFVPPVATPPIGAPPVVLPLEDAPPLVVIPLEDVPLVFVPLADLKLEKRAFAPRCFKGGKCGFTLSVVNVSDVFFVGNIIVRDPDPVAGLGSDTSGWACEWGGGATHCQTAAALAPGERRSFDIVFDIPIDFAEDSLENCATIFGEGGFDDANPGNDDACADVEIAEPDGAPLADGPDLSITKIASGKCTVGQECGAFTVGVKNIGAGDFAGPITVIDTFPRLISFSGVAPNSAWSCVVRGAGAVECTHVGPLAAGARLPDLKLLFDIPRTFKAGRFGNSVQLIGQGMRQDVNSDNDDGSASVDLEPAAGAGEQINLSITKSNRFCKPGPNCAFDIVVTNIGQSPFSGSIRFRDKIPEGMEITQLPQDPWRCTPSQAGTVCRIDNISLAQGDQTPRATFAYKLSTTAGLTNCADLIEPAMASNNRSCVKIGAGAGDEPEPQAEFDLRIDKFADPGKPNCKLGETCRFGIAVRNSGDTPFSGTVDFTDIVPAGMQITALPQNGWNCKKSTSRVVCRIDPFVDAKGGWFSYRLNAAGLIRNCVQIVDPEIDLDASNNESCVELGSPADDIGGGPADPRLGVEKTGPAVCIYGQDCTFTVKLSNSSDSQPISGSYEVSDVIWRPDGPGIYPIVFQDASIVPSFCGDTGDNPLAQVQCSTRIDLAPGETRVHSVTVKLAHDLVDPRTLQIVNIPDGNIRTLRNCINFKRDGADVDYSCASVEVRLDENPVAERNLEVKKTADTGVCEIGETCIFHAAITNLSTLPFDETVTIFDSLFRSNRDHEQLKPTLETTDQTFCQTGSRFYLVNCDFNLKLAAGETKNYRVAIRVPDDGSLRQGDILSNALKISSPNYAWDFANGTSAVEDSGTVIIGGWPEIDERAAEFDRDALPLRKDEPEPARTPPARERAPVTPGSATDDTDGGAISGDRDCSAGSSYDPDLKRCRINERPPVICRGGKVINETCVCGAGRTLRQVSPRSFRCDRNRPTIICTGGTVKKNACVCPRGAVRQQINATTFRCETPPDRATDDPSGGNISRPTITCTGGTVNRQDNVCICPADTEKVKRSNTSWYCKPKAKACSGGRIYDSYLKQCTCPSSKPSWNTKKQVCEKKAAIITTPTCQSGLYWNGKRKRCECEATKRRRSDGKCCPSGTEARLNRCVKVSGGQTIAPGVKTPVVIRCDRGTVRKGKCICPKGYTLKTLKKNAYACEKPASQSNPAGTQTRPSLTAPPKQTTPPKQTAPSKQVKPPKQTKQRVVPSTPPAGIQCKGGKVKGLLCWCGLGKFPKKIGKNAYRCP